MPRNTFLKLLKTLSKAELKAFDKYLCGQHEVSHVLVRIFKYVKKYYPNFPEEKIEKQVVHDKVFGTKTVSYKKITDAYSDLHLKLKSFLILELSLRDKYEQNFLLLKIYKERKLNTEYAKLLKKVQKQIRETKELDLWHFLRQFETSHFAYFSGAINKLDKNEISINTVNEHLDQFYWAAKLRYHCEQVSRQKIIREFIEESTVQQLSSLASDDTVNHSLLHQCYHHALQVALHENHEEYQLLKNLVFNNLNRLSKGEIFILLTYMINYVTPKIVKGNKNISNETLDLCKFGLQHEIFMEDGFIPAIRFNNIIEIVCRLEDYQWAEAFIQQYKDYLRSSIKQRTIVIAQARIAFGKKNFETAIELLKPQIPNCDIASKLRIRTLLLRCYYELKEDYPTQFVSSYSMSFAKFLKREKHFNQDMINCCLNFVKFIKLLLELRDQKELNNASSIDKTEEELLETTNIICKAWLLKKLEDFQT